MNMLKKITVLLTVVLLISLGTVQLVMAESAGEKLNYTVTSIDNYTGYVILKNATSRLNLREHPKEDARILLKLYFGQEVTVTGASGTYLQVTCDGVTGFVHAKYISKTNPFSISSQKVVTGNSTPLAQYEFDPVWVTIHPQYKNGFVNMRVGPSKSDGIMKIIFDGYMMKATAADFRWVKVEDPATGQVGYIMRQFVYGL